MAKVLLAPNGMAPYGTKKPCRVDEVIRRRDFIIAVCEADDDETTAYACIYRPGQAVPEEGTRGTLVYTKGQGHDYWRFTWDT